MWQSRFIHELFVVDLRRGLGKGWKDENAAPFFVGIQTIRHSEPVVFGLECVAWIKYVYVGLLQGLLFDTLFFDVCWDEIWGGIYEQSEVHQPGRVSRNCNGTCQWWGCPERSRQGAGLCGRPAWGPLFHCRFSETDSNFPWISYSATKMVCP